jgi:predicted HD superfamily hydrolase involved in NAD metabolism
MVFVSVKYRGLAHSGESKISLGMGEYKGLLKDKLTEKRYDHALAVCSCAAELAGIHGLDRRQAELAGLLHDYARDMPPDELLRIGRARDLVTHKIERQFPLLLHGPVGAALIKEELGIHDPQVLEAVAMHTLAGPAMGRIAQIVYIADLTAVGRDFPLVDYLRKLSQTSLDQALLECIALSIRYCLEKRQLIHPQSIEAWNYYSEELKGVE